MTLMKSLRARVKQEEEKRSRKAMQDLEDEDEEVLALDDEEQARAREEKIKKASQPKYHWIKFPLIRDGDDFAKGVLLNKKKVKQSQLKWQDSVINNSLYDFQGDKELTKLALRIHKALLGAAPLPRSPPSPCQAHASAPPVTHSFRLQATRATGPCPSPPPSRKTSSRRASRCLRSSMKSTCRCAST